jgi:hypothetical protein
MRAMILLAATTLSTLAMLTATSAASRTAGCGSVIPPLPPGAHEEQTFYKVTASRTSCQTARDVARTWLTTDHGRSVVTIDRCRCRLQPTAPKQVLMLCRRDRAAIRGYTNGD